MKKVLLLTSVFATIWAFLAGCTESAEVGDVFSLSQTALKTDVGGGEFTVNVQSKCDWTAECSADWVIVSPASGQAGKGTLTVTVLPNHETETRNAEITIGNIQYDILNKITVTQEKFSPEIETDTKEIRCDVVGKTLTVTVESNIEWTAECSADWVTVSPAAGQAGESTLTVKVEGNFSAESRNAEITIGNEQYDVLNKIAVTQEKSSPKIEPATKEIRCDIVGKTLTVSVESNIEWKAKSNADWITVSPAAGQAGTSTLTVTVQPNHETETRNAEITIGNEQYDVLHKIAVIQEEFSPEMEPDTKEIRCGSTEKTLTVTVESNIEWKAKSNADWITVSPASGQAGKSTLTVKVEGNFSVEPRNAEIEIRNEQYDVLHTIAVTQEKFSPKIEPDTKEIQCDIVGKTLTVSVESNIEWTAESGADWITVSPASGQAGKSTLTVKVEGNFSVEPRNAEIEIRNEQYDVLHTIAVTQEKFSPKIEPDTKEIQCDIVGKTLTVSVESNIEWTAESGADWVIVSPASGLAGKSTLTVTVQPNYETETKSTEITIGNVQYDILNKITVTQEKFTPEIETDKEEIRCNDTEKTLTVTVESNIEWTAGSGADWVIVSPASGQAGKVMLTVTVQPNYETETRSTEITIGNMRYNISRKIKIEQESYNEFIYIPDDVFRTYLLENFDSDGDRRISRNECKTIEEIDCNRKNISSLQGIEYFTALKSLNCRGTEITELDLSNNPDLQYLWCFDTELTALDLSKNTNLQTLNCSGTKLTALDLSRNPDIWMMNCSETEITELDLSKNPGLNHLNCYDTKLTVLDLSQNTELISLNCYSNPQLKTIYLKTGQNIETLDKDKTTQIVYK